MGGEAVSGAMKGDIGLNRKVLGWLKRLHETRETGCSRASAGTAKRELFFRDGSILGIRTTVDEERLGELLIRLGRITRQHFEDASIFVRHGWRLGEIRRGAMLRRSPSSERDAAFGSVAGGNRSTVQLDEIPRDRKTQTGPAVAARRSAFELVKPLESRPHAARDESTWGLPPPRAMSKISS